MEKVFNVTKNGINEEKNYSKRMAALVMMIIYAAALSPMYVLAEERSTTETAIERFINTGISHTSERTPAENVAEDGKILVAEAPEKHAERTVKADHTNRVSESKETAEAAVQESKLLITKKEGGVIELGRVKIEIPPKSVKEDTEISITRLLKVNETGETIKNVTEENGGYRFLPKGTKFKKKVLISMPYSAELNLTEGELNELYTYFYDEEKAAWIKLERKEIDKENCLVKSYTTHFTDMINATLQVPETAGPVDFNINSIKSLEAARPDGHLLKFNPPKGTSSGDAAFSFTLDVPAGRKGMQPQVSVGYSSAGGSGIMGKGFDVNYGSTISIDTRKKLPDYDESDAYLKDGVKLKANGSTNKEYRLLRRSVREKIERHNAFSKDDWWEITDTHGTVYRYGYYKAYETTTNNAYAGKKDENGKDKIYTWYLSEVEDVDGNTILYEYEKDMGYVYPSRITYTGNVNDPAHKEGKYIVKFNYIKSTDEKHREDVRIDARSRFVTECRWLLGSIESGHVNRTTRKYSFEYNEGLAKEKYLTAFSVSNGTTEKDSSYTYRFEYNELEKTEDNNGSVTYKIFDEPHLWFSLNSENYGALGLSSTSGKGSSGSGSFGIGVGRSSFDARVTGGLGSSSFDSTGYTNSILLDINGDLIPDLIKQNGNNIYVYLCEYNRESKTFTYRTTPEIQHIGTQMNLEKTETSSSSYNVYGGAGAYGGGAGYSYAHTNSNGSSESKTGFADIDGDGLEDIVTGSNEYYRNETKGNNVKFTKYTISSFPSSMKYELSDEKKQEYSKNFPIQRPIRAWKVCDDGIIGITQKMSGDGDLEGKVYIDAKEKPAVAGELENVKVKSGQYIYFVPDLKKGKEDWNKEFEWNVKIQYKSIKPFSVRDGYVIPVLPARPALRDTSKSDLIFSDDKINLIKNFYRTESESHETGETYYAVLKDMDGEGEFTEENILYILNEKAFIPGMIWNKRDSGNSSFTEKMRMAADKNSVRIILNAYTYDAVEDCYRFTGNSSNRYIVKNALDSLRFDYGQFLKDVSRSYGQVRIKKEGPKAIIVYTASTGKRNNIDERKIGTFGKLSNGVITINDEILEDKIQEYNLKTGILTSSEKYEKDSAPGKADKEISVSIRDKNGRYRIVYRLGGLTYVVPELTDEEFQNIYSEEYNGTGVTDLIIEELESLVKETEDGEIEYIEKSDAEKAIGDRFVLAIKKGYLEYNDENYFKNVILKENEAGYEINKNITDEEREYLRKIDKKYSYYDFVENIFSYYTKKGDEEIYWVIKDNLTNEDKTKVEDVCKKHGYGLYQNTYKTIEYLQESEYDLKNGNYELLVIKNDEWEKETIKFQRGLIDSKEQYSDNDKAYRNSIGKCIIKKTDANGNEKEKEIELCVNNEDTLYGGENGWLYGIWQGNETENRFSKKSLTGKTAVSVNEDDYEDYDVEAQSDKYSSEIEGNAEENLIDYNLSYYLPFKTEEFKEVLVGETGIKNGSLVGNVDVQEESSVTDVNGCMNVVRIKVYSAPSIYMDKITCNRLGGTTYYKIDGIRTESGYADENFCINKSRNESEEDSHGPQLSFGVIGVNGSFSSSTGTSYQEQAFQDVTGDGIPDVIQSDGSGLSVKRGKIVNEKELTFEDYSVSGINGYISECTNSTRSTGAGVSATAASVQLEENPRGVAFGLSFPLGTGKSEGSGNNTQLSGFIDLNGDGITDYIDLDSYKIGNGKNFETKQYFSDRIALSESSFKVEGKSVNAGIGLSGGKENVIKDEELIKSLDDAFEKAGKQAPSQYSQNLKCSIDVGTGKGISVSTSSVKKMYFDVNGDGLIDIVRTSGSGSTADVMFNTGSSFTEAKKITFPTWDNSERENPLTSNVSTTTSTNTNIGLSVNISVPVWIITLNFTTSLGGGPNRSSTVNLVDISMADLDGDGKTDQVMQMIDGSIWWKKNITGKAGLLKCVYLPQGGKYEIEYEGEYGTTDNPNFKYVMSEVKVSDGINDVLPEIKIINDDDKEEKDTHEFVTRYSYEGAYYDREEKESYGYNKVKTINSDKTYSENTYSTKNTEYSYNLLGSLMSSVMMSGKSDMYKNMEDKPLSEIELIYLDDDEWILTGSETKRVYEKNGEYIESTTEYGYDEYANCSEKYGNVTSIKQYTSDRNVPKVYAYIGYDIEEEKYIVSNPEEIKVFDKEAGLEYGDYLRYRKGTYDESGRLKTLSQYYDESKALTSRFEYYENGNIKSAVDASGITIEYGYDSETAQFIENIKHVCVDGSESYVSEIEYNKELQLKEKETDCNGNSMEYSYDSWQRLISIKSPEDTNGVNAISYRYYCPEETAGQHALWTAVTENKVNFDSTDIIETIVQIDGFGSIIRTAKTGFVMNPETKVSRAGWNVSGASIKDSKGRILKIGKPYFVDMIDIESMDAIKIKLKYATEIIYDEKDREIKITTPFDLDNEDSDMHYTTIKKEYRIGSKTEEDSMNIGKFITKTTDAKGNITEQTADAGGNVIAVVKKGVSLTYNDVTGELISGEYKDLSRATYKYNALGQMMSAFDMENNEVKVTYDLLGRRTGISSVDGGTYYYEYNSNGNLERMTNTRLLLQGKHITYLYDKFNRIEKIIYPDSGKKQTVYTYGSPSETRTNAKGKLLKLEDESGTIEYEYGLLGEVEKETRTLRQRNNPNAVPVTFSMEYKCNYLGQMRSMTYPDGEEITYEYDKAGQVCSVTGSHNKYVEKIGYDENGQRIYIKYGNGVETLYTYGEETGFLDEIETQNVRRNKYYQNIKYNFDKAGNILGYTNDCLTGGNYITKQNYSYDNLYQLIGVRGETEFNKYNIAGAPTFKGRYSQSFNFDNLGNMTQKVSSEKISVGTKTGDNLNYSFDYEIAEGFVHRYSKIGTRYYEYDEVGNVICEQEGAFGEDDDSSYYSVDSYGNDVYGVNDAWGYYTDSSTEESRAKHEKYHREFTWDEKNQLVKSVDNTVEVSFVYAEGGKRTNKYTATSETLYYNSFWTYYIDGSTSFKGGSVSKHVFLGDARLVTTINDYDDAVRKAYGNEKNHIYFYHADHLGSAQLVTDCNGEEYQRLEYTPYGETWVDIKIQGNKELSPLTYRFSAKELDEETGFYYYGARYLDPKYSRWISADPAMNTGEYFPGAGKGNSDGLPGMGGVYNSVNLNLYHYAGNNPIKYSDPNGKWGKSIHYTQTMEWLKLGRKDSDISNEEMKAIKKIAYYDKDTDSIFSGIGPFTADQKYHFNTNENVPGGSDGDSRKIVANECLAAAAELQADIEVNKDSYTPREIKQKQKEVYKLLGHGLHALQDIYAHTDDFVANTKIDLKVSFFGIEFMKISFIHHTGFGETISGKQDVNRMDADKYPTVGDTKIPDENDPRINKTMNATQKYYKDFIEKKDQLVEEKRKCVN